MRVLVTGATGFLGKEVVRSAVAAGHQVYSLCRPNSLGLTPDEPNTIRVCADLRHTAELERLLRNIEGVIHCAAAATGDLATQLSGTVVATENLLAALPANVRRFVHVSTFSVYDFAHLPLGGVLSESTPTESRPQFRDAYTQTKLLQEALVREFSESRGLPLVIARPGAIYGPGKTWGFGCSVSWGRFDLVFSPLARMRLIHVRNCADALVTALSLAVSRELVVNLVDSEQPSHWRFHRLCRRHGLGGWGIPVPYTAVLLLGLLARLAGRALFRGKARLPELFDLPRQRVRWKPLRYSRNVAKSLGFRQHVSLESGIRSLDNTEVSSE